MRFEEYNLDQQILNALVKANYQEATPIQEQAIPCVLEGRDMIGCAQTGTGKTAAFALPILNLLNGDGKKGIRSLILTPTRELAIQIFENFKMYGRYLNLRTCCIYGGAKPGQQIRQLEKGCDILVATPGRLQDFMNQGLFDLDKVEIFVLDEADRMLDMGFISDIRRIVPRIRKKHQTLLFSATMPVEIEELADDLLIDPVSVRVAPVTRPTENVDQSLCFAAKSDKVALLAQLLRKPEVQRSIIFTRTKHGADRLVRKLKKEELAAVVIHGDRSQGQRQAALEKFRSGQVDILVATDVVARGLDIPKVTHVFNYELPQEPENYIHRIGRSGRAGERGTAISFCCEEELDLLYDLEKMMDEELPVMPHEFAAPLERIVKGNQAGGRKTRSRNGQKASSDGAGSRNKGRNGKDADRKAQTEIGRSSGKNRRKANAGTTKADDPLDHLSKADEENLLDKVVDVLLDGRHKSGRRRSRNQEAGQSKNGRDVKSAEESENSRGSLRSEKDKKQNRKGRDRAEAENRREGGRNTDGKNRREGGRNAEDESRREDGRRAEGESRREDGRRAESESRSKRGRRAEGESRRKGDRRDEGVKRSQAGSGAKVEGSREKGRRDQDRHQDARRQDRRRDNVESARTQAQGAAAKDSGNVRSASSRSSRRGAAEARRNQSRAAGRQDRVISDGAFRSAFAPVQTSRRGRGRR